MNWFFSFNFCTDDGDCMFGKVHDKNGSRQRNSNTRQNGKIMNVTPTPAIVPSEPLPSQPTTDDGNNAPHNTKLELMNPEPEPDPELIGALLTTPPTPKKETSTHLDEELGLTEYVSKHTQKGKKPFMQESNKDSVVIDTTPQYTGHEKEIIINFSPPQPSSPDTDHDALIMVACPALSPEPSTRSLWESKLTNNPAFDTVTPLCSSNMIQVNHQFIVADDESGLYAFDAEKSEWNLFMEYAIDIQLVDLSDHSICYDSLRDIIYIFGEVNGCGAMIYAHHDTTWIVTHDLEHMGSFPALLMINNTLHLVTGIYEDSDSESEDSDISQNGVDAQMECQKHYLWNYDMKEFVLIFTFPSEVHSQCIVNIKSKQVLLLLDRNGIWIYHINDGRWNKLNDMKLPKEMKPEGHALSRCENYVIVYGCGEDHDKMFVFDLRDLDAITYFKSTVSSPEIAANYKCLTEDNKEDQVLIAGYVRTIRMDLPNKVIQIIEMLYIEQYIHIISSVNSHFKALVPHILNQGNCDDYFDIHQ